MCKQTWSGGGMLKFSSRESHGRGSVGSCESLLYSGFIPWGGDESNLPMNWMRIERNRIRGEYT